MDGPFQFRPPVRRDRPQDITKTLQKYEDYRNAPPGSTAEALTDYMMTIPFARPSLAQNSGDVGLNNNPSYARVPGYADTPSGHDTRDGDGLRSLRQIMDFGRDIPYTPGPRESSNVIDARDPFQGLLHNLQTVFGRRD